MKKFYLSLFLIVFIFSYVNCSIFSDSLSNDFVIDIEKLTNSLSNDCIEEEKNSEYSLCVPKVTLGNYKQSCENIKSEKCQKFYSDSNKSKYFPICSKNPLYNEYLQPFVMEYIVNTLELKCITDENDDLCPVAIYSITNTGEDDIFDDNCKSKQCTELLKNYYEKITIDQIGTLDSISTITTNITYDDIIDRKEIIPILESDDCVSKQISDAISIKVSNILLITLSLLLLLFIY